MTPIHLNVDAGEVESNHSLDLQLIHIVNAVNVAVGGHAGSPESCRALADAANEVGCEVNIHPSYPDRKGFGRHSLDIQWLDLSDSLNRQRMLLPEINSCKFHGALYNDACKIHSLANQLAQWCVQVGITKIITMPGGALAEAAANAELHVVAEGFADRSYLLAPSGLLSLVPRTVSGAVISEPTAAASQAIDIAAGRVRCIDGQIAKIQANTICVHGDGKNCYETLRTIRALETNRQSESC